MELRWQSSLRWFSQIWRFKNWKLNFCCLFYIFGDLQELRVWRFFILFLNFVEIFATWIQTARTQISPFWKKFAIWPKKSLPTNGLICQQVCDVTKVAMIDLVKFGYKLNMDVILWNLPLNFWLPALSQCFFFQVCEVKVGNRCQKKDNLDEFTMKNQKSPIFVQK